MAYSESLESPAIVELVRRKARRMGAQSGFTSSDVPDIEQSLFLKLLKAEKRFDSSKGSFAAFAQTVIDRKARSIAAKQAVNSRRLKRTVSIHINVAIGENESVEFSQQIAVEQSKKHRGVISRSDAELAELLQDLPSVMKTLSANEQDIAEALKWDSIAELARRLNMPRTSLYWTIKKIAHRFEEGDLRDYLP